MTTITIHTENKIAKTLTKIAEQKLMTLEEISKEALLEYLQCHAPQKNNYSFIGIGHSGKGNISTTVKTTLQKSASRREGWSLPK